MKKTRMDNNLLKYVGDGIKTVLEWIKIVIEAFVEWEQTFVSDWEILNTSLKIIAKILKLFI